MQPRSSSSSFHANQKVTHGSGDNFDIHCGLRVMSKGFEKYLVHKEEGGRNQISLEHSMIA